MGLDITAFRNLKADPTAKPAREVEEDNRWTPGGLVDYTEKNFPGRASGILEGVVYQYEDDDTLDFSAGSYVGYNRWRAMLAHLAGLPEPEVIWETDPPIHGPFVELIDFSDCEGVIGPIVSAKLAKDFRKHEKTIMAKAPDDYFRTKYRQWRTAFEMAAHGGAVVFH